MEVFRSCCFTFFLIVGGGLISFAYSQTDVNDKDPTKHGLATGIVNAVEGQNVTLSCNVTMKKEDTIQWEFPNTSFTFGVYLSLYKVDKKDAGRYICRIFPDGPSDSTTLNILIPATLTDISIANETVSLNGTFRMNFTVSGDPPPATTLTFVTDGSIIQEFYNIGFHTITMNVTCNSTGGYRLYANNLAGNDIKNFNISVVSRPTPSPHQPNRTQYPRTGDNVQMVLETEGCSPPTFLWQHKGKIVNHTDDGFSSEVHLDAVAVEDYGTYFADVENAVGDFRVAFNLLPEGPPDTPTSFVLQKVGATYAVLSWITGYDYAKPQTFVILLDNGTQSSFFREVPDKTSGLGNETVTYNLTGLAQVMMYHLSLMSMNRNGSSGIATENVTFSTLGIPQKDPNKRIEFEFSPRLNESVNLTMHAVGYPPPTFIWFHGDSEVPSSSTNYTSTIAIPKTAVKDYGQYVLTMSNEAGQNSYGYFIKAKGPPEPISDLQLRNLTLSSANITWVSGYDYNTTQTFVVYNISRKGKLTGHEYQMDIVISSRRLIMDFVTKLSGATKDVHVLIFGEVGHVQDKPKDPGRKERSFLLDFLQPDQKYNITVISSNIHGASETTPSHFLEFVTYGKPVPDPSYTIKNVSSPRLGQSATFKMKAIGNPVPAFSWTYQNVQLNHTDHNYTTEISISDVTVNDYGTYTLSMSNVYGNYSLNYLLKADGLPGPIKDIEVSDETDVSANITFLAGFNYDSEQTFTFLDAKDGTVLVQGVKDQTDGHGTQPQSCHLDQLQSSTEYRLVIFAQNARGNSTASAVHTFTTKEEMKPGKSSPDTATVVGIATGSVAFVLIVVIIVLLYRWMQNRRRYDRFDDDSSIGPDPDPPHMYRYDDASTPTI